MAHDFTNECHQIQTRMMDGQWDRQIDQGNPTDTIAPKNLLQRRIVGRSVGTPRLEPDSDRNMT